MAPMGGAAYVATTVRLRARAPARASMPHASRGALMACRPWECAGAEIFDILRSAATARCLLSWSMPTPRTHHTGGSGGSLVQVESAASRPHCALRACLWPRHRIDLQAVSEATSGHQWLVMGGTSAGGGRTVTWTYGGSCGTALRDGSHGVLWSSLVGVAACNSHL